MAGKSTINFACSCNRSLSVPARLGGKRIKCTRCNRTLTVPEATGRPRPQATSTKSAPPVPAAEEPHLDDEPEQEQDDNRNLIMGSLTGLLVVVLLLLMWILWPRPVPNLASAPPETAVVLPTSAGDAEMHDATSQVSGLEKDAPERQQDAPAVEEVPESEEPVEDPAVVEAQEVGASASAEVEQEPEVRTGSVPETKVEKDTELTRAPSRGGTRKTISGLTQSTVAGVKVYGSIALVCDISGSMHADLPNLLQELREKFPADTPLILVSGCSFSRPTGQQPIRSSHQRYRFAGNPTKGMNTYSSVTITDAILFAASELQRDTVMFNCDLQDGGSEKSIVAFQRAYESSPFRLSGRSLERDAPERLLQFIRETGGDFVLDPIYRKKQPALHWAK